MNSLICQQKSTVRRAFFVLVGASGTGLKSCAEHFARIVPEYAFHHEFPAF